MEEKFMIVSLDDKKSKDVAKVISSDTSRKILDELSKKRMSMSEISEALGLPISTVQYNMDMLKQAGFVVDTAYRYSDKGKKILYYEPAKKVVVFAPKGEEKTILEKIKLLFIPLIFGIAAISSWLFGSGKMAVSELATEAASAPLNEVAAGAAVPMCRDAIPQIISVPESFIFMSGLFLGLAIISLMIIIWRWKLERQ